MAEVSSRTYVSKLERAQSSPTLEMMATLSGPLDLSPLTLVAITIGAETGQSINSLVARIEREVAELKLAGVLAELGIPYEPPSSVRPASLSKSKKLNTSERQAASIDALQNPDELIAT